MSADLSNDPHIRALRDVLVAEHEATVARWQHYADEAAQHDDEWLTKWYQEATDRLRAMPYPGEQPTAAA